LRSKHPEAIRARALVRRAQRAIDDDGFAFRPSRFRGLRVSPGPGAPQRQKLASPAQPGDDRAVRRVLLALLIASPAVADKRVTAHDDAATKARAALAVIDGTTWVDEAAPKRSAARRDDDAEDARRIASRLQPWRATILGGGSQRAGTLTGAERLDEGDGIHVRRPQRAFGAPQVVEYVRHAVGEVRALYPDVPTLAIGDLSSEHGGALAGHVSHRSGRDVDVGFYFHHAVSGFADANDDLDLDATWALLAAFARTASRKDGVQIIFLDYAVQKRLYAYAKARGTPDDELAFLFQYPAGKNVMTGLVRHWPNHANHLHVRFK
jgi:murein endopeptidase